MRILNPLYDEKAEGFVAIRVAEAPCAAQSAW